MNAVILAGGRGSRLMPLTSDIPKPMLPIAGYPIIDYVTAQLYHYGIKEEILALGYRAECIEEHVKGYRGIKTVCSVEKRPLGTCGSVKYAGSLLSEVFVVMSGDCVSDIDINKMIDAHLNSGAEATVAVGEVEEPSAYGVVGIASGGKITALYEKPGSDKYGNCVNLGAYIVNKSVLSLVPDGQPFDFSKDLFPLLIKRKSLYSYRHDGYWSDLGDLGRYFEANKRFINGFGYPMEVVENAEMIKNGTNIVSKSARLYGSADGSVICGKSIIARDAHLCDCVVLGGEVFGMHFKRIIKNGIYVDI